MNYDLFIDDENLAKAVIDLYSGDSFVDTSTKPLIYQFFDLTDGELKRVINLLENHEEHFELRDAVNGDFIWPNRHGLTLEQAVDLI